MTNAQYLAFVWVTGHSAPDHWSHGKFLAAKANHPVVKVSWYDAITYCHWLAEVTGRAYTLPSEAEWEKGARGTDGRIYPWGREWDASRCNSYQSGPGDTTPVGAYPGGASPYGLLDMSGNVWEWTRSLWGQDWEKPKFKYPYRPGDGRENLKAADRVLRVMRGGSWDGYVDGIRCAVRAWNFPIYSYGFLGFRVVSAIW